MWITAAFNRLMFDYAEAIRALLGALTGGAADDRFRFIPSRAIRPGSFA